MTQRKIKVGSRDSKLAVIQTESIMNQMRAFDQSLEFELITLKTTGDKILDKTLDKIGGKGLFVKELDQALLEGRIDMAVHSLKDMPIEENEDLPIAALSKRGDPRDALVLSEQLLANNCDIPDIIASSSARRTLQIGLLYPEAVTKSIRGNIITRLKKLDSGESSALILAAAGLIRAGLESRISRYFTTEEMIPAAGQGILAVQTRRDFDRTLLTNVDHEVTRYAADAEREFIRCMNGGCCAPIAAYAQVLGNELKLTGLYCEEGTSIHCIKSITGDISEAKQMGCRLAEEMKGEL